MNMQTDQLEYAGKRCIVTGGHFAPMEMPELLVDDLRQFFRTLRNDID